MRGGVEGWVEERERERERGGRRKEMGRGGGERYGRRRKM